MVPTWPAGPGRPGVATAAAVLGLVTAGLTALMTAGLLFGLADGDDEAAFLLTIVTGVLCAAGFLAGGIRLLSRTSADLLFATSLAALASLALIAVVAETTLYGDDAGFLLGLAFLGAPLPAVTAVLARSRATVGWASSGP
ncbi:hypothetical protein SAMN05660662_4102 [Blastococcus aurantiacus]|uniref:Uncharacterized protein n=1 Tax=Blastococcus aurantiacus TaxID=1550231 RepID=A0A1G7QMY4_9ACTN|nr:hypothetical protein SAMN05660662_4102 [Blastococcus aurantiacus]